jgi:arginase
VSATADAGLRDSLALLGVCSDENSSLLRGAAEAPPLIRAALFGESSNPTAEAGVSLADNPRVVDLGDMSPGAGEEGFAAVEVKVAEVAAAGGMPLVLGGDHSVTYPVVSGLARVHGPLTILHFDAHPDLYDAYGGNRFSHASPFARIMEQGLARRLVQVGIRTLNAPQRAQVARFGVEVHEMRSFAPASFDPDLESPAYLSFDLDALDPAFAPGVSHFEPGGLSVRDVLSIVHKLWAPLVGADVVEYNPRHDHFTMTAMVAAKLVKEIGAVMLRNSEDRVGGSARSAGKPGGEQ